MALIFWDHCWLIQSDEPLLSLQSSSVCSIICSFAAVM
jgi:hypothetical protein